MLNIQYRMNEVIMNWSSSAMYHGELKASESVKDRLMIDLCEGSTAELVNHPLLFIDTAGALMYEAVDETSENDSKFNFG